MKKRLSNYFLKIIFVSPLHQKAQVKFIYFYFPVQSSDIESIRQLIRPTKIYVRCLEFKTCIMKIKNKLDALIFQFGAQTSCISRDIDKVCVWF